MAAALLGEGNDSTEQTAAVVSPPDPDIAIEPEGSETVRIPRLEQTARLPQLEPTTVPATSARRRRPRGVLIVAGVILAVMLVAMLALIAFTGPDAPASGAGTTGLPPSLEDAFSRLEESVRP
jgi:hypothetical protein